MMGVALSFLRNFGILSGASGVLGALSASVATLAADDPYDRARAARQQERNITGVGEGLAEGGEALGAAFYRGFTGLIAKPLEGAKRDGVGGEPPLPKGVCGRVPLRSPPSCDAGHRRLLWKFFSGGSHCLAPPAFVY